eukprot:gene15348-18207_t
MGGCISKESEAHGGGEGVENGGNSAHAQQLERTKKRYNDEHKNNLNHVAINWKFETVRIWKRTHDIQAIHTDVPRLGHKIDIIDKLERLSNISFQSVTSITLNNADESPTYVNGAPTLSERAQRNSAESTDGAEVKDKETAGEASEVNGDGTTAVDAASKFTNSTTLSSTGGIVTANVLKKQEVVLQILVTLAHLLDGEEKERAIREQYTTYIKGVGDMSQQLVALLGTVVGETSRMMAVLKVCHQKIILPAYYFIKANMFDLPFRDKRGSWRMRIIFEEDGSVTAIHSKRQQSTLGSENDPDFEFEWTLSITFDKEMQIAHLKVDVVDLIISKNIKENKKQEIQSAFSTLQLATTTSNSSSGSFRIEAPIPLNKVPDEPISTESPSTTTTTTTTTTSSN